jgi:hypothetical protein
MLVGITSNIFRLMRLGTIMGLTLITIGNRAVAKIEK